ncbi:glycoside hydrolase family 1 protein [Fictibacillus barbaricus]|uniref:Glycoside hydrolase family 1 protein n=1 Tax=Fictibacillus barbaricus TaxID=182136 RepID=A0ABS2ZEG4_9BACL|nr:glycoside hydrolase family 1 protein [Fictibacillus barbaricus]MBN3546565.1 glycoside hydrolase family 1 protein [Fictibacillus barbaricus]GGB42029.1 beta-glucosidase [Fictibacillus barbaricus]
MNETNQTYSFPSDFWWGSAASGPQTEGAAKEDGRKPSIWDYWYSKQPECFHGEVGPEHTSNFYHMYKEDIQLMKKTGHNSFRTSIQWSRLIPDGKGTINEKAVQFYNDVINELIANDIEPIMNLYHFDMPMCMQEKGGWESREVVDAYVEYAKTCFELFGDRVKYWFTFNEPIVPVEASYLYNLHYPHIVDFKRGAQVAHNTIVAHAKAVAVYKKLNLNGRIGIILNLTPSYPRSKKEEDVQAAHIADLFFNRSFLDPVTKGVYPAGLIEILKERNLLPAVEEGDLEIIQSNPIDLLGVNYYQPRRVKAKEEQVPPEKPFMPEHLFDPYIKPDRKINPHRGWEICEEVIYDIMINIRDHYDNIPFFISENGMGVEGEEKFRNHEGYIEDDYRIEFIQEHLKWVHKGLQEGANCLGYHLWTFMDNWSWANAYKNRYGLVEVDLNRDFKRTIKKSGQWYKALTDNHGFTINRKKEAKS